MNRLAPVGWILALVAWLTLCAVLGRLGSIGQSALPLSLIHVALLLLLVPLIRWFPIRRRAGIAILGLAVVARGFLLPMEPTDDLYRYIWEGRVLAAGHNPYELAPDDPSLVGLRDGAWTNVNHRDMTAIYPPGALLAFRGMAAVSTHPTAFKLWFALFDVLAIAFLVGWLRDIGRRPEWALLYALNPVVLLAFAGEGHLDILMILPCLAALRAHERGHGVRQWIWFALSLHGKYVSVLLLPFLVTRRTIRTVWVLPLAILLPALPFTPWAGIADSLMTFSGEMHYNDSLHRLLAFALGGEPRRASILCAAGLGVWVLAVRAARPRPRDGAALVFAGLLLLSPNVHYWYLTWMIPFLCVTPMPAMLAWCGTIVFSFVTVREAYLAGEWLESTTFLPAQYLPVAALLVAAAWVRRRPLADARPRPAPQSVSVIVPVLNDDAMLENFLAAWRPLPAGVAEIVVCDAGTNGPSPARFPHPSVKRIHHAPGRGGQIRAGIAASTGDVILVAHADMQVDRAVPSRILDALAATDVAGGSVGCRFEARPLFLRIIEGLNRLRARVFGISFGDQGQFIRRDALEALGGFPPLPLMEDVELSYRMREQGPPLYLGGGITVSARRWQRRGHLRNAFTVIRLVAAYSLRRWLHIPQEARVDAIYRAYYGHPRTGPGAPPSPCNSVASATGRTV